MSCYMSLAKNKSVMLHEFGKKTSVMLHEFGKKKQKCYVT